VGKADTTLLESQGSGGDAGGVAVPMRGGSVGRFVVIGVVGRGGMGVVLSAFDPELDRKVALKLLADQPDAERRARLLREAQAMARLSHPNVVTVYEVGHAAEHPFIAMELVEGTTLRGWLAERPRGWREIVEIFVAAGRGLVAAHDAGLVHRDFKPDNVLLGRDGRPRVGDFGLSASGIALDDAGKLLGTPSYMAPEQWLGGEVDARTDQFAFCTALWRALWEQAPFADDDVATLREAVLAGHFRKPPTQRGVPGWIEPALRRGLDRDPRARWPSLEALLDHLERRLGKPRRMQAVTQAFHSAELERAYLADSTRAVRNTYRLIMAVSLVAFFGVWAADRGLFVTDGNLAVMNRCRVVMLILLVLLNGFGFLPARWFQRWWRDMVVLGTFTILVAPVIACWFVPDPERVDMTASYISVVAVMVAAGIAMPIGFPRVAIMTAVVAGFLTALVLTWPNYEGDAAGWVVFAAGVTLLAGRHVNLRDRVAFAASYLLEQERLERAR
jgi:hypothetical protein